MHCDDDWARLTDLSTLADQLRNEIVLPWMKVPIPWHCMGYRSPCLRANIKRKFHFRALLLALDKTDKLLKISVINRDEDNRLSCRKVMTHPNTIWCQCCWKATGNNRDPRIRSKGGGWGGGEEGGGRTTPGPHCHHQNESASRWVAVPASATFHKWTEVGWDAVRGDQSHVSVNHNVWRRSAAEPKNLNRT